MNNEICCTKKEINKEAGRQMKKHEWAMILIREYREGLHDLQQQKKGIEDRSNSDSLTDKRIINSMISEMKLTIKMLNRYIQAERK